MKPQKYIKCSKRFAEVWGLDVAVVMEQVKYWLVRNSEKTESLHQGVVWFYCSIRELTEKYFPYWTPRQLTSLLNYMVKIGLLRVGRFNKRKYDRTKWYTVVDSRILEEDDYVPERKTVTKRRATSHTPVCSRMHAEVKGSDTDANGSDPCVKGSHAGVERIVPSSRTYTTTKQEPTTEERTRKEQLNISTSSLRSDVEGEKESPSNQYNPLFEDDKTGGYILPLPHTEGVTTSPSVSGGGTQPPLRREGTPIAGSPFDGLFPSEPPAKPSKRPTGEELSRMFDELFKEPEKKNYTQNNKSQTERIQL